jgi:hydrogenase expression/formation protein HypC
MCIGIPMRVLRIEAGHALCVGRGEQRRVRTALVDPVALDDWLLVFLDSARERLDAERAAEIDATLDLLEAAMAGQPSGADVAFELPSRIDKTQLLALTGAAPPP